MSGSTLDIPYEAKNKDQREQILASYIPMLFIAWKAAKSPYEAMLVELTNNIYATSTETIESGALPFSNNVVIPKLTQIRDILHAKYMDSLFGPSQWFEWKSSDKDSVSLEKAQMITATINNKLEQQKAITVLSQIVRDWIDTGNCYARLRWVNETTTLPNGDVKVGYVGPKIERISVWDIVFNPQAASFENCPKIIRSLKSLGELRKMVREDPDCGFTDAMLDKLDKKNITTFGTYAGTGLPDTQKSIIYSADGFSGWYFYQNYMFVELLEFMGDIYMDDTYSPNRHVVILNRQYVIKDEERNSWDRTDYVYHAAWRSRPDNLYGQGPLDNILGMQYILNKMTNQKADLLDQYANPSLVTKGEVEIEGDIGSPGQRFTLDSDATVEYLRPDTGATLLDSESDRFMGLMEQLAIVPPEAFGFRQPGERTLGEANLMNAGAQNAYNIKVKEFEMNFLEHLLNDMLEMQRRNMTGTEIINTTDPTYNISKFITITREDLQSVGKLSAVGSRYQVNNAEVLGALSSLSQNPALLNLISPHISRTKLAEVWADLMNISAYKIVMKDEGIVEDIETQEIAQKGAQVLRSAQAASQADPTREESAINYPQQDPIVKPASTGEEIL